MLAVFFGSNVIQTRGKALDFVAEFAHRGIGSRTLAGDVYEAGAVRAIIGGVSLFGGDEVVVLDTLSDNDEAWTELLESIDYIRSSSQNFVIIEGSLSVADKKVLEAAAETFIEAKAETAERFNPFAMADALAKRDKKSLWLLLTQAKSAGLSAEEIIGTLSWQLKSIRLAHITSSAKEAGMKDFTFNKSKAAARTYKSEELATLSSSLVTLYHEGHLGGDIDLALEKWALTI